MVRNIFGSTVIVVLFLLNPGPRAAGDELKEARVTRIIREVNLLPREAAPRPASVNDPVRRGTAVRTGVESRTELTFTDQTLARLGANTIFSFEEGTRKMDLSSGAMLLRVPKDAGGATITTAAVTAAITGTTVMLQFDRKSYAKFIVLEGTACMSLNGSQQDCVPVRAGQLLAVKMDPPPTSLPAPVEVDLSKLVNTSALLSSDFEPLPSLDLIQQAMQAQSELKIADAGPTVEEVTLATFSAGTDAIDQRMAVEELTSPTPTPTPPPSTPTPTPTKYGTPAVIASPVPYEITSGTTIQTDPTITTNGVTDYGKIYRGPMIDGPASAFAFGNTSAFDLAIGFDNQIDSSGALFKFQGLRLTGNPTVSTANGEIYLALISVGDITSAAPGGILTFAGIRGLLLATQNGSINLGAEISFSGFHDVTFYARGANSNLTLASAISGGDTVRLGAEGNIQVNGNITVASAFHAFSGGDFLVGSGIITATNIDITALGNINIDTSRFPDPPGGGGSILFNAANTLNMALNGDGTFGWNSLDALGGTINLTSQNPTTFNFSNSSSVIFVAGTGGFFAPNIDFLGGGLNLISGAGISIGSLNSGGGTGAIISAATSFNASGDVEADNLAAGTTVNVGGALVVYDNLIAGANIGVGHFLQAVSINASSSILTVQGGIFPVLSDGSGAALQHTFNLDSIVSPAGIDFSGNQFNGLAGLSSGGALTINANTLTFDAATGIGFANFNGADGSPTTGGPGGSGGRFVVNALGNITVNAPINATTGLNRGPAFGGDGGAVELHSTNGSVAIDDTLLVSSNDFLPVIEGNLPLRRSASGGSIEITSSAASGSAINIGSTAQLLSLLDSDASGPGGSIVLRADGAASSIDINNSDGQIIADRGLVDIRQLGDSGAINLTNGYLYADIIKIGALGANGALTITGGTISAETILRLYAGGSNGSIVFAGNVTLNSPATLIAARSVTIRDGVVVTISGANPALVFANLANYSTLFGGNGTTSGVFAGAGASTQPFVNAPPFDGTTGTVTVTYNPVPGGANWSNPAVWNPMFVPNNGGLTFDVVIGNGTITQDIAGGATIEQLFMNGGSLVLTNPLTLNSGLQFTGGTIRNGTLNVAGVSTQSALMTVSSTTINNSGDYALTLATGNVFSGASSIFNNSGSLTKNGAGTVSLNIPLNNTGTVTVQNGTLRLTPGGTLGGAFSIASGALLELTTSYALADGTQISGAGMFQLDNNTTTTLLGTLTNNGTLSFANAGSGVDLRLSGSVSLAGNGLVSLNNFSNNRIFANISGDRLTIGSGQTIQGSGNLGVGQTTFTNNGTIIANQSTPLVIQPGGGTGDFTNSAGGIVEAANGGTLQLLGGNFVNNSIVQALNGSLVQLLNGVVVSGNGSFLTAGSGLISVANSATLNGLTFVGNLSLANNTTTTLLGTLTNNGTLSFANAGSGVDLVLSGSVSLAGNGLISLNNFSNNRIFANISGDRLTIGSGQTIQGSGNLGVGQTTFTNNGTIIANQSTPLVLQPGGATGDFTNNANGILRADGGTLQLSGGIFTNNGNIQALNGSIVQLTNNANVVGGTLATTGSAIHSLGSTLTNVTNNGDFVLDNNTTTTLLGTLTNNGTLSFANAGSGVDLRLSGSVSLAGNGLVSLNNFSNNRIFANISGDRLTIGSGQTIQGSGNLGVGQTTFTNNGTIIANQSTPLVIQPGGGTGDFTNSAGGIVEAANGGTLQLLGGNFVNNSIVQALNGSLVQLLNGVVVSGNGSFLTAGSGLISVANSATLNGLTFVGNLSLANNTTTTLLGTLTNNGTLSFANAGSGVDLVLSGSVSLAGNGLISLNNFSNNRIFASTPGNRLTIGAGQTIQGSGNLGVGQTTFTNNGIVIANQSTPLVIQPSGGGDFTNLTGALVEATNGATLQLSGGSFANNSIVQAQDGSAVQLLNGVVVSGNGSFLTFGTGLIRVTNSATLTNLTYVGNLSLGNNTTTTLLGTLTNNGTLSFANAGTGVDLVLSGSVSLAGNGLVSLNNFSNNRIFASTSGNRLTIGAGQTILGSGNLGVGQTTFTNNGTIIANQSTPLVLQPSGGNGDFTNNAGGILRADGGTLQLSGGLFNNVNLIQAFNGSQVQLVNSVNVTGGSFATATGGSINSLGATLTNVTNTGNFVLNNNTTTTLLGTLTNNGTLSFGNAGSGVDLRLSGSVSLAGSGLITLNDFGNNRIFANTSGDRLTIGSGVTIQGSGNLGLGQTTFSNNGTVIANQSNALLLQPGGGTGDFINSGILRADGAILQLTGGTFNNSGTIAAINGGTLRFNATVNSSGTVDVGSAALTATGNYTQSGGTFRVSGGSVQSNNALNFQGGLIDAFGNINAAITNNAMLRPALGGSGLAVTGNISLLGSSQLIFQIGGLAQGSQYGFLNVNGSVSLGGQLVLSFVNGFQNSVGASDSFTLMSTNGLSGAFSNIASGNRLTTSDGSGSFLVNYNGNQLVISAYQPGGPVPPVSIAGATGSGSLVVARNRRPTVPAVLASLGTSSGDPEADVSAPPRRAGGSNRSSLPLRSRNAVGSSRSAAVTVQVENSTQLLNVLEATETPAAGRSARVRPARLSSIVRSRQPGDAESGARGQSRVGARGGRASDQQASSGSANEGRMASIPRMEH